MIMEAQGWFATQCEGNQILDALASLITCHGTEEPMSAPSIPVLDLSQASAEKLGVSEAIKGLGFLALKSPEEPTVAQVSEIFRISQQFFENESVAEKERCQITVENKGWVKKRQER